MSVQLNALFANLWQDYIVHNPQAEQIHQLLEDQGEFNILNDHIALRTFNHPKVGIDALSKAFTDLGYVPKGEYEFSNKHLFARHFENPEVENAPRVFISELLCECFSRRAQAIIGDCIAAMDSALSPADLGMAGTPWGPIHYHVYQELLAESEYAAWMYAFGFRANHFTISINALQGIDSVEAMNKLLKDHGFVLNSVGGEVKGTPEQLLEQSSTLASQVPVTFSQGTEIIGGCYYEFAKRYTDASGALYNGFVASSADKIFESTDSQS